MAVGSVHLSGCGAFPNEIMGIAMNDAKVGDAVQVATDGKFMFSSPLKEKKSSLILPEWKYQNNYKIPTLDSY